MAKERFNKQAEMMGDSVIAPARRLFAMTPSDTVNEAVAAKGFLVTVAGDVACVTVEGDVVTVPVLASVVYPIQLKRVNTTNTTATGIIGLG